MSRFTQELSKTVSKYNTRYMTSCSKRTALKAFIKINFWSIRYALETLFQKRPEKGKYRIGFIIEGGIGDKIISLQWIRVFMMYLKQHHLCFSAFLFTDHPESTIFLVQGFHVFDQIFPHKKVRKYAFDLLLNTSQFVSIVQLNHHILNQFPPTFQDGVQRLIDFSNQMEKFKNSQYHGLLMQYCILKGWNRYDLMGACGLIEYNRHTLPVYQLDHQYVNTVLCKYNLQHKTYVTIHSGVGRIPGGNPIPGQLTKTIPMDLCNEICRKLNAEKGILTIQIGASDTSMAISEADICLLDKTTFQESIAILSAAKVHIDNDSGLVHFRHILNKRSVVLWGPTDHRFIGYDEDINIQSPICQSCMWMLDDWNTRCARGFGVAECMHRIDADRVLAAVHRLLTCS